MAGESKTGLGFDFGPRQQKYRHSPNVYLMGNPAVHNIHGSYRLVRIPRFWRGKYYQTKSAARKFPSPTVLRLYREPACTPILMWTTGFESAWVLC